MKCKKYLSIIVIICMMLPFSGVIAKEDSNATSPSDLDLIKSEIVDLDIGQSDITLESNGYSEYIDVFAVLSDGSSVKVDSDAVWQSDNQDVAVAIPEQGRILAQGKGTANITISYGGFKKSVSVNVLREVDLLKQERELFKTYKENINNTGTRSLTSDEREDIRTKALAMISLVWTPKEDYVLWKSRETAEKDTPFFGIPYSQTPYQMDNVEFYEAYKDYNDGVKNKFYTPLTISGTTSKQPRYGNDCSGFTSIAWGISRQTTLGFYNGIKNGTYGKIGDYDSSTPTSPEKQDLLDAYELMDLGDAVVKRNSSNSSGHVFIIAVNDTDKKKVQCFEQTPFNSQITYFTYDQLAISKYMPFSK